MGGGTMHVDHLVPQLRNNLNNNFTSSSSTSSSNLQPSLPTDTNTNKTLSSCCCNNGQLCRKQEITATGCVYNHVFETVPSQREVQDAISALQEFMKAVSSTITVQQISDTYDSRIVLSQGYKRLYDALQLLQADPAVKRLVVSLSSDEAIWDAVIRNVLHQRLLELPDTANCQRPQTSEQKDISIEILNWIFHIMKDSVPLLLYNMAANAGMQALAAQCLAALHPAQLPLKSPCPAAATKGKRSMSAALHRPIGEIKPRQPYFQPSPYNSP